MIKVTSRSLVSGLGGVDGMKSSPGGVGGGGPGTPREDSGSGMGDYNLSKYLKFLFFRTFL